DSNEATLGCLQIFHGSAQFFFLAFGFQDLLSCILSSTLKIIDRVGHRRGDTPKEDEGAEVRQTYREAMEWVNKIIIDGDNGQQGREQRRTESPVPRGDHNGRKKRNKGG